jgi:translation initiation factor 4E
MASISETESTLAEQPVDLRLPYKWIWWSRLPQTNKTVDYDKTLRQMLQMETVDEFVYCYQHLNKPSVMPAGFDYAFFKDGIRPIWEDPANRQGGKWVLRLRKGVADFFWDNMLLGLVGNLPWEDNADDICGAVLSVRKEEDILSLWIRTKDHDVQKIR